MAMTAVNYEAWARTMIGFIRSKGLERELTDWAGGFPCPIECRTAAEYDTMLATGIIPPSLQHRFKSIND